MSISNVKEFIKNEYDGMVVYHEVAYGVGIKLYARNSYGKEGVFKIKDDGKLFALENGRFVYVKGILFPTM